MDLPKRSDFAMTFQLNDLGSLKDRNANYSKTIRLPITPNNRDVLGFADIPNSSLSKAYTLLPCQYWADGVQIVKEGVARIKATGESFEVNIFSGAYDFFQLIKGKTLDDLDFSDLDHFWNFTNIEGSQTRSDYNYPLIQYGANPDGSNQWKAHQLFPCLYVKELFDRIIAQTPYTFVGGIYEDPWFEKWVIPSTGENFKYGERYAKAHLFTAQNNTTQSYTSGIISGSGVVKVFIRLTNTFQVSGDPLVVTNGYWNETQAEWTEPHGGKFDFLAAASITNWTISGAVSNAGLVLADDPDPDVANIIANVAIGLDGTYQVNTEEYEVLTSSPLVFPAIYAEINTATMIGNDITFDTTQQTFSITGYKEEIVFRSLVHMDAVVPDLDQSALLQAVMQMTASLPVVNELRREITLLPFADVVTKKASAPDWSAKLVRRKNQTKDYQNLKTVVGSYGQTNYLQYKKDKENSLETLGEGSFTIPDTTLRPDKTVFTLPFAGSDMGTFPTTDGAGTVTLVTMAKIPYLDPTTEEAEFDAENRILYLEDGGSIMLVDNIGGTWGPVAKFKRAIFEDATQTDNLSFANNLKEKYYKDYETALNKAQLITVWMDLSPTDIEELDLTQPIYLKQFQGYYLINKVKDYIPGRITRVEIFKV